MSNRNILSLVIGCILCLLPKIANAEVISDAEKTNDGEKIVALSKNGASPFVIKADGTLWQIEGTYTPNPTQPWILSGKVASKDIQATLLMHNVRGTAGNPHNFIRYALLADGTVWSWGINWAGQYGNGILEMESDTPVQAHIDNVIFLDYGYLGSKDAFALKKDHSLWGWGAGTHLLTCPDKGQLPENVTVPKKIMENVRQFAQGKETLFVVDQKNQLWAWGRRGHVATPDFDAEFSQIDPQTGKASNPTCKPRIIMRNVQSVAAGDRAVFVVKTDASLWGWGDNTEQEVCSNQPLRYLPPVWLADNVKEVYAGKRTHAWIDNEGRLWKATRLEDKKEPKSFVDKGVAECSLSLWAILYRKHDGTLWAHGTEFDEIGLEGVDIYSSTFQIHLPQTPKGVLGKFDADVERWKGANSSAQ